MDDIIVSIIIPVYNPGEYLLTCLDKVAKQSFPYYEIICIDDMSTDGSYEVLKEYSKINDRMQLFKCKKHSGAGGARNVGLENAKGKYIWFVDADDSITVDSLNKINDYCSSDPDIVFFEMEEQEVTGISKNRLCPRHRSYKEILSGKEFFRLLFNNGEYNSSVCTKLIKRQLLLDNNIFFKENIMYEDELFLMQVFIAAKRVLVVDEVLYIYQKHEKSVMTNQVGYYNLLSIITILCEIEKMDLKQYGVEFVNYYNLLNDCAKEILLNVNIKDCSRLQEQAHKKKLNEISDNLFREFFPLGIKRNVLTAIKGKGKVYLWGAGRLGKTFGYYWINNGNDVKNYIVSDTNQCLGSIYGVDIISFDEYLKKMESTDIIIIMISDRSIVDSIQDKINMVLERDEKKIFTYFDIKE